jgi:hypothetical protein
VAKRAGDVGVSFKKNSTFYRRKFERLFHLFPWSNEEIKSEALIHIHLFCVLVAKKSRILMSLDRFEDRAWYEDVEKFISTRFVDYGSEETDDNITAAHVVSCNPSLSALCWCKVKKSSELTIRNFLSNQWAAQLALSADLLGKQKIWEKAFWTDEVKFSNNPNNSRFTAGFNEAIWTSKSQDHYPLLSGDMEIFPATDESVGYTKADLIEYFKTFPKTGGFNNGVPEGDDPDFDRNTPKDPSKRRGF